ncbi:MAG: GAF domain-containing protein [Casimicrobiaceae bacterium]
MDRGEKTAKATAGAKAPAGKRAPAAGDTRSVAQKLADSLAQQAATSEILRVMAASPSDVLPVMQAVAQRAAILCGASFARALIAEGDRLRPLAHHSIDGESPFPMHVVPLRRTSITGRALLDRSAIHHADILPLLHAEYPDARDNALTSGMRAVLAVPLVGEGGAYGGIVLWRREPGLFAPDQVALVETFAQQAAIAIESVRLSHETQARTRELAESLRQQTATNEVLKAISRSAFDLSTVLQMLVESATLLCEADKGTITRQRDGRFYRAESYGFSREFMDYVKDVPIALERGTGTGRALLEGRVVHIPDVQADPEYMFIEAQRLGEFRTMLSVPMLRDGVAIGALALTRTAMRPFTANQISLVSAFADQAAIAIENVRLFSALEGRNRDLTEALQQQTATSEILRLIARSPTDTQPVFDLVAQRAGKLCDAEVAVVSRLDGERIELAAIDGVVPEAVTIVRSLYPMRLDSRSVTSGVIRGARVIHIADVLADQSYELKDFAIAARYRGALGVPILRDRKVIGSIFVGKAKPGLFSDSQVDLLKTFADQAVIAIENVRLFNELDARTMDLTRSVGELKALQDVGQAVSSTLDLETVLSTIVSRATQLAGMDGGSIYEYDEDTEEFYLHTADRLPDAMVDALRSTPIRKGEGALGRMAVTGEPVQISDIMDEGSYQSHVRELLIREGHRSLLAVPLLREDHLLGGLVVNRKRAGEFDADVIALLQTFATQSALAIQNARLFREIELKSRQLETASRHKSEFLANMSHELRTPLNAIIGFSEVLAEKLFGEMNAKQTEYVGDITESGRHLLSLINDILDLSKIEAGRMELDPADFTLATAIDNTLSLVRERAQRRSIRLSHAHDERVTTIHADERKVRQVLLNLLSNALKFTPEGGAVSVRTTGYDDRVEVAVTDTGVGIAPEDQETVFEEFRQVGLVARKIEGTGLGLAISRKIVELQGGAIRLTRQVGVGSTFTFSLPLR